MPSAFDIARTIEVEPWLSTGPNSFQPAASSARSAAARRRPRLLGAGGELLGVARPAPAGSRRPACSTAPGSASIQAPSPAWSAVAPSSATINAARRLRARRDPASGPSTVVPTVSTRKKMPMSSVASLPMESSHPAMKAISRATSAADAGRPSRRCEQAKDTGLKAWIDLRRTLRRRLDPAQPMLILEHLQIRGVVRRIAGEHLVEHHAQRVEVAADGRTSAPGDFLGRHVGGCAESLRGAIGEVRGVATITAHARNAEVRDVHGAEMVDQDVRGLEIAMENAGRVRRGEASGDRCPHARHFRRREPAVPAQQCLEVVALDQLHGEEGSGAVSADVMDTTDGGVRDPPRQPHLVDQPTTVHRAVDPQGLERDREVEHEVVHGVDHAHATDTELSLDSIAPGHHRSRLVVRAVEQRKRAARTARSV